MFMTTPKKMAGWWQPDLDDQHKKGRGSGPAFAASDWREHCLATWGSTAADWGWRPHQTGPDAPAELTASGEPKLRLLKGCRGQSCHGCTPPGLTFEQAGIDVPAGAPAAVDAD